jgi:transcriptional regulator with XRE-family HTH domain
MARLIGVSHSRLSNAELGREAASERLLEGYEKALALPAGSLVGLISSHGTDQKPRRVLHSTDTGISVEHHEITVNLQTAKLRREYRFDVVHRVRFRALRNGVTHLPTGSEAFPTPAFASGSTPVTVLEGGRFAIRKGDEAHPIYLPVVVKFEPLDRHEEHEVVYAQRVSIKDRVVVLPDVPTYKELVIRVWNNTNEEPKLFSIPGYPVPLLWGDEGPPISFPKLDRLVFSRNRLAKVRYTNLAPMRVYGVQWEY